MPSTEQHCPLEGFHELDYERMRRNSEYTAKVHTSRERASRRITSQEAVSDGSTLHLIEITITTCGSMLLRSWIAALAEPEHRHSPICSIIGSFIRSFACGHTHK